MLLLLLLPSLTLAEFLTPVLDHDDEASFPDLCQQDTVMSCHLVQVDIASLHKSTLVFNDTTLDFLDQPGTNTFTFSSEDGDEATFTVDTELGAVWGHAQLADGRDFVIEPNLDICNGCHVVIEEDIDAFPHDQSVTLPAYDVETRSNSALTRSAALALLEKGKTDKTTLVTYTIKVYVTSELKESTPDIRTVVEQLIATTNQGYINSKIPLRASLHCLEEITDMSEDDFTNPALPRLDIFHQYRGGGNNLRGSADAAVLLVKHLDRICGTGYKNPLPWGVEFGMVSMTDLNCGVAGFTFAHELGHNFGNDHDKYEKLNLNKPYSQGYHIKGTKFRTIMAYYRPRDKPKNRQQINYYSNPNVKIGKKKARTGKKGKADAARMITEVRFVIAANGDESETCPNDQ